MKPRNLFETFLLSAVAWIVLHAAVAPPLAFAALPGAVDQQAGAGAAQQEPLRRDEKIVVTAEREAEDIRNVGSSVSVIGRDEIAASGARWLVDVLQFAPGVNVVRSGPAGSITQLFLRGSNTGHTLFLIDGVKVNSPTTGAYDLSAIQLAADQIERVEVVRGPQSSLYGSQAVGGVINVITRSGAGPGTWGIEADGGSFGTGRVHTWGMGEVGAVSLIGGVSYLDSSGFSSANEANGNLEPDGHRNLSYNGRADYRSSSGVVVRGFLRGFDTELEFDGFDFQDGPVDALLNVQTSRENIYGGAIGWQQDRFSSRVELSSSDADLATDTPEDFFTRFELDSTIREVDWQNDVVLPGNQRLVAGLEYRREGADSVSFSEFGRGGFEEKVDVIGIYIQDRVRIGNLAGVSGAVRYEDHSAFGGKWTGRATATVDASDLVRVHGSVGTGFKAPTLNDLYFPGFSNPDLMPEESIGADVGIELLVPAARSHFGAVFFYNDIRDLIEFDFVASRPENLGNVMSAGAEINGEYVAGAFTLAGNYTYTDATPEGSDEQLIRRPRHQGSVRVTVRPTEPLRLWAEVRAKGESFDNGVGGRERLDGFGIVNLAVDYRLVDQVVLRARVDNLFDTAYEEVLGFGTAGLSGYFGAALTLDR